MFLLAVGLAWMAGLIPGVDGIDPQTTSGSLLVPFLLSGIGIGLAVAPVTSAVMATAPKDRVGNASGVLSTTRQVGSLMGIAILGAVLQNRVTANITEGVQAISQIPEALKQKIIAAAASGSMQMGAPSGGVENAGRGAVDDGRGCSRAGSPTPSPAPSSSPSSSPSSAACARSCCAATSRTSRRNEAAAPGSRRRRRLSRDGHGRDRGRRGGLGLSRAATGGRASPGRPSPVLTTPTRPSPRSAKEKSRSTANDSASQGYRQCV